MIGTPLTKTATKFMLLGCGELGKEVIIEAQRFGIECIAVDRYKNAPAMQVAHKSYVINMNDGDVLEELIRNEKPDYIIPEIEAIDTKRLLKLEKEGFNIIPKARATNLTMNREGIRRLAAEELGLKTADYRFADNFEEFKKGVKEIGIPCVIKPIQSSSGKGQSTIKSYKDIKASWDYAFSGSRGKSEKVIIEEFIHFDSEITLLTVRHIGGTSFCTPIGHYQEKGDYRESWQPQQYSDKVLKKCQKIAKTITDNLGGRGIFGVELFIKDDKVYFSEVSPRPHDTGLVTLVTQNMSEFELHVRAILGLPIPEIKLLNPGASRVLLASQNSENISFEGIEDALTIIDSAIRLFGKPNSRPNRRLGVLLAKGKNTDEARNKTKKMLKKIRIIEK